MLDLQVQSLLLKEQIRQQETLCMLASENMQSQECLGVQSSAFANKTLEGSPGKRYHAGGENADTLELLAIQRLCDLYGFAYANVQPHSGSQANHIVYRSLLLPGDRVLAMDLDAGGHLSHGAPVNMTADLYNFQHYGISPETDQIDYDALELQARAFKPKLIICGGSSYPRAIRFERVAAIARSVGALMMIDMAHFSGQVAAGLYPHAINVADVVTSTFYKSLRGPRGAFIMAADAAIGRKIDRAVFPGYQGTPAFNVIAAKAVNLHEARMPTFRQYVQTGLDLAQKLNGMLHESGLTTVSGGTDTSMVLVDLRDEAFHGKCAADTLEEIGIIANHNLTPFDRRSPMEGSGLRLSTNVMATRHLQGSADQIFHLIVDVLLALRTDELPSDLTEYKERLSKALIGTLDIEAKVA